MVSALSGTHPLLGMFGSYGVTGVKGQQGWETNQPGLGEHSGQPTQTQVLVISTQQ